MVATIRALKSTVAMIVALTARWIKKVYDEKTKQQAKDSYFERVSMRGVERIFDVPRQRLAKWLVEEGENLSDDLTSTLAEPEAEEVLELDEVWSFVLKKANKRWIWIALSRRTRQVVAYVIGDRSEETCRKLWERIPDAYRMAQTYSDFWEAYQNVFPEETHQSVGKEAGQTNHVERWNNTLRQRLARLMRRTLSFSKSNYLTQIGSPPNPPIIGIRASSSKNHTMSETRPVPAGGRAA